MKSLVLAVLLICSSRTTSQAQDTASVTFIPTTGNYLLQYTVDGIQYGDTLEPSTKIDPVVTCLVAFDTTTSLYKYSYVLSLLPSSQQHLLSFATVHPATILSPEKPNNTWMMLALNQQLWEWSNSLVNTSGLHSDTTNIAPGHSLGGFSFKSAGLPAIVNSYLAGNAVGLAFTGEPPSLMEELLAPLRVFPNDHILRKTICPTPPPTITTTAFTDTISSYTTQARALNWILDQSTANKYTGLLGRVHSDLNQQNKNMAVLRLDTAVAQVQQDSVVHLMSEAYALLRFNVEYLQRMIIPTRIGSFTGTLWKGNTVRLNWTTVIETNNNGFEVQKAPHSSGQYQSISSLIPGHGTTYTPQNYTYLDQSTTPGAWDYRLKQINSDLTVQYSAPITMTVPE